MSEHNSLTDLVADVLREGLAGRYGDNNGGWMTAFHIRNVLVNSRRATGKSAEQVRRALRSLPVERGKQYGLIRYRLRETAR